MKKAFLVIGAIVLLYFWSVFFRAHQWEKGAEKYLEATLLNIAKPWSTENHEARATWGFLEKAKLKPSDIATLANNRLGALIEIIDSPKCNLQQGTDIYSVVSGNFAKTVI